MTSERISSSRRRRLIAQTRACVLWGLGIFLTANLGMWIATQTFMPHLRDPEFGYKLNLLKRRMAAEPDRPLLVLLGSSRTGQGLRPGVMPDISTPDGRTPLVFNFSQVGSGPLSELVALRRLLRDGIRPNWLAIEILPALLGKNVDAFSDTGNCISRTNWDDLQILCDYLPDTQNLKNRWYKTQLYPWHAHRFSFMNHYASDWVPWRLRLDHWKSLDPWGWSDIGVDSQPLVLVPAALEVSRMTYREGLQHFRLSSVQDRALRDLLALCRQENIPALLYLMPEGDIFRSWYAPATSAALHDQLSRISLDCRTPVVDARLWMQDKYFGDSHHLYRKGASLFTQRFGPEVLARLVQGRTAALPDLVAPTSPAYPQEGDPDSSLQTEKSSGRTNVPMLSIHAGDSPANQRR